MKQLEHLEKNVLDYATVRACLLRDGTEDRQIIFQRPSLLFPPVEKTARLHPMVGHPPPPRDHPDEDIRQGVLGVLAQPAKPVQEALRERGAYLMLLVQRHFEGSFMNKTQRIYQF